MSKKKNKKRLVRTIIAVGGAVLITTALAEQIRRPPEERTWQGKKFGIPYDFRMPTQESLRSAYWNSETAQILVPRPFGMGWTINFYPIIHPKPAQ
jgi:hypothetical protein